MTSPELLKPLRSTSQVVGDRKRSTIAKTLHEVEPTYFILLDRGSQGWFFSISKLNEPKSDVLDRILKIDQLFGETLLAVYEAYNDKWRNVTKTMIALAREGDTT